MTALQQCTGAKFVSERLDLPRPVNNFNQRGTWVQTWTETDLITKNSHYFNFEIGFGRDCEETGVILEPTLWRFDIREQKKKHSSVTFLSICDTFWLQTNHSALLDMPSVI